MNQRTAKQIKEAEVEMVFVREQISRLDKIHPRRLTKAQRHEEFGLTIWPANYVPGARLVRPAEFSNLDSQVGSIVKSSLEANS